VAKILVSDPLPQEIVENLKLEAEVEVATGLSPADLAKKLQGFDALIVRSQSKVTKEVIEGAGASLRVIGRAGVGVDNIDVEAATSKGIMVINSPEGNTISAAEHTFGLLLAAARWIPQAQASMRRGEWDRKTFTGFELYTKTLGVVGFGRIGREVAERAAAFRMKILAYDPFVSEDFARERGAELVSLEDLLRRSDFVTLHMPKTAETDKMINAERLSWMKPTAILVNCARGGIVCEEALAEALKAKKLAAAALDVFSQEPLGESPLLGLLNFVSTPHLAASTHEAQERVAVDVAEQILEVLRGGAPRSAVNIPYVPPEAMSLLKPYLALCERMGKFAQSLAHGPITHVSVSYCGEITETDTRFLTKALLRGILAAGSPDTVNFVNAALVARNRGIHVNESSCGESPTYASHVELTIKSGGQSCTLGGTVFGNDQPRVVELDGYPISVALSGTKLITWQTDRPGVMGRVGSLLGGNDINIAEMQLGRSQPRAQAVMVMSIDEAPSDPVMEQVRGLDGIEEARLVHL
jgi:D-3-phosphoglycerate dehydrogenase